MERTFGPQVVFHKASSKEQGDISRRAMDCNSSATSRSTGRPETLTVTLKDVADRALWSITLDPAPPAPARVIMRL